MCRSTKAMKTIPLIAISSFSAIVERVDLAFWTRLGVAVATIVTVSPATGAEFLVQCDISRSRQAHEDRPVESRVRPQGAPLSFSHGFGQECSPSQVRFSPCTRMATLPNHAHGGGDGVDGRECSGA